MRRRSSAGGEPAKAQRRKTVARKSRVRQRLRTLKVHPLPARKQRSRGLLASGTKPWSSRRLQRKFCVSSARRPETCSRFFEAILENATRICEAIYGAMWLREGDGFRNTAFHGALPEAFTGQWRSGR